MSKEMVDVIGVLESLPDAVKAVRLARRKSLREVARESGVSFNTIKRIEDGQGCTLANAIALLRWLA